MAQGGVLTLSGLFPGVSVDAVLQPQCGGGEQGCVRGPWSGPESAAQAGN